MPKQTFINIIWGKGNKSMTNKVTSSKAAKAASKVLKDGRTSKASKTAAGSALSQTPSKTKTAAKSSKK